MFSGWKRSGQVVLCVAAAVMALHGSADAATASFSYAGAPVPIPDFPGPEVGATIPVAGFTLPVHAVKVSIDGANCASNAGTGIEHTFVGDLQISLQSPSGQRILIINRVGGSGRNFCQVVLDDAAPVSIQTVNSDQEPFTGTWRPNRPLGGFHGENANGNWTLFAQDLAGQDVGTIRAWTITITDIEGIPVPTLSQWGMILMSTVMALIGLAAMQWRARRQRGEQARAS
jgi:subtilisin-like proprotein convertase family protein